MGSVASASPTQLICAGPLADAFGFVHRTFDIPCFHGTRNTGSCPVVNRKEGPKPTTVVSEYVDGTNLKMSF